MPLRYAPLLLLLTLAGVLAACEGEEDPIVPATPDVPQLTFVGGDACAGCHEVEYHAWRDSGHASALVAVDGALPTNGYPAFAAFAEDPAPPPPGYGWEDVHYVVGGYSWKMNWLDADGLLVTGDEAEYHFADRSYEPFVPEGIPDSQPTDCGPCHTTGWVATAAGPTAEGSRGFDGSFFAGGVQCEECHGMGSFHVAEPDSHRMEVDRSPEACARCHRREADDVIAARDGFIRNYQQYSEWIASPHGGPDGVGCNGCHDPHASVIFPEAELTGITRSCESCHPGFGPQDGSNHPAAATCIDCHMPKVGLSAVSPEDHVGDVRTHIVNIAPYDPEASMFSETGDRVVLDAEGQAWITIDYVCLVCHGDSAKSGSTLTRSELAKAAERIHGGRKWAE